MIITKNNNLYLNRVTQSNDKNLPWGPLACLQVTWVTQGYKVVQYIAFRYRDLKEGRDGAHLIAPVKLFQALGNVYEMHVCSIDLLHFVTANNEEVAFPYVIVGEIRACNWFFYFLSCQRMACDKTRLVACYWIKGICTMKNTKANSV